MIGLYFSNANHARKWKTVCRRHSNSTFWLEKRLAGCIQPCFSPMLHKGLLQSGRRHGFAGSGPICGRARHNSFGCRYGGDQDSPEGLRLRPKDNFRPTMNLFSKISLNEGAIIIVYQHVKENLLDDEGGNLCEPWMILMEPQKVGGTQGAPDALNPFMRYNLLGMPQSVLWISSLLTGLYREWNS